MHGKGRENRFFVLKISALLDRWNTDRKAVSNHCTIALFTIFYTAGNDRGPSVWEWLKKLLHPVMGKSHFITLGEMPEAKLQMSCDFRHILERVEREKKSNHTDIFTVITSRWCYLGVVEFLKKDVSKISNNMHELLL